MANVRPLTDNTGVVRGCLMPNGDILPPPCDRFTRSAVSKDTKTYVATSKFNSFTGSLGIDGSKESYISLGVGALGGIAGFLLHKTYPKFGMAGKIGYVAIGAAAGYFGSKAVMKKM